MYNRISTDDELIKSTFKRIKTIEERKDYYIINNKFQITKDGIVYYGFEYDGDINKDFPQYVFEIAEFIKEIEKQPKYLCMEDYQKGEFGMYRIYSMEGWRQQAIDWCDTDDNYERTTDN